MILHLDPQTLTDHPATKLLPPVTADCPAVVIMRNSIAEAGIQEPLQICRGMVVDGRVRQRAAIAHNYQTVPCLEMPESEVSLAILHKLIARHHYTKSGLAYVAFPLIESSLKAAKARRLETLRQGDKIPDSALSALCSAKTAEELADNLGFCRRNLFAARNIHGHFKKCPAMREHFEPLILNGEMGLGQVAQGIAGWDSTKGKPKGSHDQLEFWGEKLKGFTDPRKFAGWEKLDAQTKAIVAEKIATAIREVWPKELAEAVFA